MSSPSDPKQSKTPPPAKKSSTSNTSKPRQRQQFESRRVHREPTVQSTPWYSNWRILVPIAIVVIVGLGLLAFALGQNASRQATPATALQ
ncbi:MAG: hypothetical protein U0822_00020, partial [Anaerolineae bacterium]